MSLIFKMRWNKILQNSFFTEFKTAKVLISRDKFLAENYFLTLRSFLSDGVKATRLPLEEKTPGSSPGRTTQPQNKNKQKRR